MRSNEIQDKAEELIQAVLHNLRKFADRHQLDVDSRVELIDHTKKTLDNRVRELVAPNAKTKKRTLFKKNK